MAVGSGEVQLVCALYEPFFHSVGILAQAEIRGGMRTAQGRTHPPSQPDVYNIIMTLQNNKNFQIVFCFACRRVKMDPQQHPLFILLSIVSYLRVTSCKKEFEFLSSREMIKIDKNELFLLPPKIFWVNYTLFYNFGAFLQLFMVFIGCSI